MGNTFPILGPDLPMGKKISLLPPPFGAGPRGVLTLQELHMIQGKNIILLMDSHLEDNFSIGKAAVVFDLASRCLQYEPRDRPNTKDLVATLAPLQINLITIVIARGTVEENNTRNFGNPVQPMLPTSGELQTALMSNIIMIHT
uniref:Uncharacterized protein n=1 Tax=Cucumis melo TaxID=3656 RepID=A0A9I9ELE6_CUCME